jgi:hypothetical protein
MMQVSKEHGRAWSPRASDLDGTEVKAEPCQERTRHLSAL